MRLLVCGGRDFKDKQLMWETLDAVNRDHPVTCVIHGAYRGADMLADEWAKERGIDRTAFPANWTKHQLAAGPIRNTRMLKEGKPDAYIAFAGHDGTSDMVAQCEAKKIPSIDDWEAKPPKGVTGPVHFKTWVQAVKAAGEKPIPEDDPVFAYAESAGIPFDYLRIAWQEFRTRHSDPSAKRYKDFRRAFRNCIRGNWYKIWFFDGKVYRLTTNGVQAERAGSSEDAA